MEGQTLCLLRRIQHGRCVAENRRISKLLRPPREAELEVHFSTDMNKHSALTFDEWSEHGYRVKAKMKSSGRNDAGQATFTVKQVWFVPENKRDQYLKPIQSSVTPPVEIANSIALRKKTNETRHGFIDLTFNAADQQFKKGEEPPW